MLNLPIDLQRQIADYIVTCEDLKSLCLTSRLFHSYVIPRLYERVHVRTWDNEHYTCFMGSVAAVVINKFHHTRTLVIEEERLVAEPMCNVTKLRLLNESDWKDPPTVTVGEKADRMSSILNLFPEHVLRRFCWVANRSMSPSIVEHLQTQQQAITELYCPSSPEVPPFLNLRQLHIYLLDLSHLAQYLQHPHTFGRHIEDLSLILDSPEEELDLPDGFEPTEIFPSLKKLTLAGMAVGYGLNRALLDMLNIPSLTHLSMLNCWKDNDYMAKLGQIARKTELQLEHLAVNLHWAYIEMTATMDIYLGDLLDAAKHINSLHIEWNISRPLFESLVDKICAIGPRLELLSLHQSQVDYMATPLSNEELKTICKSCPNLRQIGFQFHEETYTHDDGFEELKTFVEAIRHLKNLQMVHIRLSSYLTVGQLSAKSLPDPNIMKMQVQMVVNKMFGALHRDRSCPKLDAMVFGHMEAFQTYRRDEGWGALPQFCFMKAEQRDRLGRVTAVGVPVSRALLRKTQPYTDVLDMDPGTDSWNRWAWQAIS